MCMNLSATLRSLDYSALPLSDYSRQYILGLLPALDYHLLIYRRTLDRLLDALGREPQRLTLVDYGGGHGFFSLVAKERGVGRVVYVDINPQAAEAVQTISRAIGQGPDVVITGDAATLRRWSGDTGIVPDAMAGFDVVEHIYRLEPFFADLFAIHPALPMMLTTGSNPSNPLVCRRLHRIMDEDEHGYPGFEGFLAQRRRYIRQLHPEMDDASLDRSARLTRGLTFDDIPAAIQNSKFKIQNSPDPHNTCDPATGSWTERLLPIDAYRNLLAPHGATLRVASGFYNPFGTGAKPLAARLVNPLLPRLRCLAPFITLEINLPRAKQ